MGAATTVITRAQIEKRGAEMTVAEVLRSVPGLDVWHYGGEGQPTSVFRARCQLERHISLGWTASG